MALEEQGMSSFMRSGMFSLMGLCLCTIAGFTRLFVDRKHMRPATGFPVADLTF